jgi:hypothetical protein
MPATMIVLFNLKEGQSADDYERWERKRDAPTARSLPSIEEWSLYCAQGLVGSDGTPPLDYIEVVQVNDTDQMARDMAGEASQRMGAEIARSADAQFVLAERAV